MAKRKTSPEKASPGLDEALERLEAIARRLEEESLSLEDSLRLFEEGVTLSRQCGKRLEEAEQKVEVLMRRADGSLEEQDFEVEGEEEGDE